MDEYIKREVLLNDLENSIVVSCKTENIPQVQRVLSKIINRIKDQPSADVAEVRHGEWKFINQAKSCFDAPYGDISECSLCGHKVDVSETNYNYCPNCGAKMDKECK